MTSGIHTFDGNIWIYSQKPGDASSEKKKVLSSKMQRHKKLRQYVLISASCAFVRESFFGVFFSEKEYHMDVRDRALLYYRLLKTDLSKVSVSDDLCVVIKV